MEIFVARQPIFDIDNGIYGYELFYREAGADFYTCEDDDLASSSVIAASYLSQNIGDWAFSKRTLINFTEKLAEMDIATLFPVEHLVIELLKPDMPYEKAIEISERMKTFGYTIVLGEYALGPCCEELLMKADIIKVSITGKSKTEIDQIIRSNSNKNIIFLAEKVESREEFEMAKAAGFKLFQGFYFSKPEITKTNLVSPGNMNIIRLINAVNKPDPDFNEIAGIIEMDPAFSYEMLRIANTAFFSRGTKIASIKQALVRLGMDEIKKWCYITLIRKNGKTRNSELMNYCMQRAKFLELIAQEINEGNRSAEYLTVGILSMLDVLTHAPMDQVLAELSLSDEVKKTLLVSDSGIKMEKSYRLILDCERGNWKSALDFAREFGLRVESIAKIHHQSIKWVMEFENAMAAC